MIMTAREYYFRSAPFDLINSSRHTPLIILIPGDALLNNGFFPGDWRLAILFLGDW